LLDAEKQATLDNKNLTEDQKANIDKRFALESKKLKRQQAKAERDAEVKEAIAKGILAVISSLAAYPFPFNAIAAAAAGGLVAFQIDQLESAPLPGYKKGVKNAPKGMAWVGEEGPELVYLKGGEDIYTAKQSSEIHKQWSNTIASNIPKQSTEELSNYSVDSKGGLQIDYERLGKTVAKHIPEPTYVQNTIDGDGIHTYVRKGDSRVEHKNRRFNT
jgi:hypothetical protein